ncbi:MAG: transaldolase, partial [Desulfobacterales bacterium]|nr:transaldolase [Desulfobacterales bacterium]
DLLYVEELMGPDTVNTIPLETLDAFRDHGRARLTLQEEIGEAEKLLADLEMVGMKLDAI